MECYVCRKKPLQQWWPELTLPTGQVVYNMVLLGEGPDARWFMLEFADGSRPLNPPEVRRRGRCIVVRDEWLGAEEELPDYVRRKALEWLEREGGGQLLAALREWSARVGAEGKRGERWSTTEDRTLLEGAREGRSLAELSRAHGRTWGAVRARLRTLGA